MSVIYLLLAISIVVAIIFFVAFILSVKSGQYDDSFTPSVRMLFEDELVKTPTETKHSNQLKNIINKKKRENRKGKKDKAEVTILFSMFSSLKNKIQLNKQE